MANESRSVALKRLFPTGLGALAPTVREVVDELHGELAARSAGERPYVLLNMASTTDGRASIGGRAGPIGNRADSELLHGLRTVVDGLLVGAETVRAEHYARLLRDDGERRLRSERGLTEELMCCIVSASLALSPGRVPLLCEPGLEVVMLTPSAGTIPGDDRESDGTTSERDGKPDGGQEPGGGREPDGTGEKAVAAHIRYVRARRDGELDLAAALRELHARFGVRSLVCEGGPTLAAHMLEAELVDELFLCLAPKLAGGGAERLRIVSGTELVPTVELELLSVFEHEAHLFLRYRVIR